MPVNKPPAADYLYLTAEGLLMSFFENKALGLVILISHFGKMLFPI